MIPEPEPVGLYVNFTSGFASINASPKAPTTFSIDVEPSVATEPLRFPPDDASALLDDEPEEALSLLPDDELPHPVSDVSVNADTIAATNNLFFVLIIFCLLLF